MLNSRPNEFNDAAESIIRVVRDDVCAPCVKAGKNCQPVNLDNPLACQCRCEKVADILDTAKMYLNLAVKNYENESEG
ncbi:hypothetical protein RYZ26_13720 [Terasakiella sp. A23]|uniref:hypothetical protein n=1 Tax=Terasakiella sp. FCG-A23 TaxID=3080561 RepID=UPI0029532D2B|nr:hypothetical protein [Terasakiella sp. A23]MDV7340659.1 hypothetical protein [Terasakiella sp. A23]